MNSILKVLESKNNYLRFKKHIKEHTLSKELNIIIKDIEDYFNDFDSHDKVDWDIFTTWFMTVKHTSYSSDKLKIYQKILQNVLESELEEEDILPIVESFIEKDYAMKITDHLIKLSQGDDSKDIMDVYSMMTEFESESSRAQQDDWMVSDDWDEVFASVSGDGGLSWRLEELNRSIGNIRKGDFIVVAARPDSGKTSFLCNEAGYMAQLLDDDQCVLWFNNEERGEKVKARLWCNVLNKPEHEVRANMLDSRAEVVRAFNGDLNKVKIISKPDMSAHDVERVLAKHNPGLIIFDQLHKIQGFSTAFSETDHMTKLYGWARTIAQTYSPVINVHQASTDAAGEMWIEMHQLYASKTGIQGEADAIITIGRTLDPSTDPNVRGVYVPKNKMNGGKEPSERNAKYEVLIDPLTGRFKGAF